MNLNEYQEAAMSTCMASSNNAAYMLLGLSGEVGELHSIYAKAIRKEQMSIDNNDAQFSPSLAEAEKFELDSHIMKELGDCLWFVAGIAHVLGVSLEDVAQMNLYKLASRKQRGVIDGSGDDR